MQTDDHSPELGEGGAETYPETLRITVESTDEAFDRAIERAGSGESAEEAVRSFATTETVRRLLTDRRIEVMRSIMAEPPASISDLAERLERNYADVHADVELLAEHRIVYFETVGRSRRPVIPYETVEFDVTIRPGQSEDAEAAA
jgi:predicted transcriptional regulator